MCTRICSIAQGQIQAEEPVKRTPFWGWFTKRFFRAWQVQLRNRPCSVFDGMALLKSCCTLEVAWVSPLKVNLACLQSCHVSFPMCVWISTCLGSLLRVLLWRTKRLQYKVKLRRLMRLWMALGIYKIFLNHVTPKFVSITESATALGLWPANGRLLWRATPLTQRHSLIWCRTYGLNMIESPNAIEERILKIWIDGFPILLRYFFKINFCFLRIAPPQDTFVKPDGVLKLLVKAFTSNF